MKRKTRNENGFPAFNGHSLPDLQCVGSLRNPRLCVEERWPKKRCGGVVWKARKHGRSERKVREEAQEKRGEWRGSFFRSRAVTFLCYQEEEIGGVHFDQDVALWSPEKLIQSCAKRGRRPENRGGNHTAVQSAMTTSQKRRHDVKEAEGSGGEGEPAQRGVISNFSIYFIFLTRGSSGASRTV